MCNFVGEIYNRIIRPHLDVNLEIESLQHPERFLLVIKPK